MIKAILLGLITAGLAVAPLQARAQTTNRTAETTEIAHDFIHIQFDLKDLDAARAKYCAPDFIEHNPVVKVGAYGDDREFIEARRLKDPDHYVPYNQRTNILDHVLIDDKYFAIHHHMFVGPNDKGQVFMDLYRVENGKIVEHWDIIQPVYENPLNGNTMWSDLVKREAPQPGDPSPEAVVRENLRMGMVENNAAGATERYAADDIVQHSPHIAAGKQALIDYFKKMNASANSVGPQKINSVSHIVTDGDLVLVTWHAMRSVGDSGMMCSDLFKIHKGKIVEHWDVKQVVPATSANGTTMW